jgi:hypothetical protein
MAKSTPSRMNMVTTESALLDLLMEMLQRITDLTTLETLLQVRLVCKTLDAASFDRFVDGYINAGPLGVTCWIFDPEAWAHLHALFLFSRLVPRVKRVTLLVDHHKEDDLDIVYEIDEDNVCARLREIGHSSRKYGRDHSQIQH